MMFGNKKQWCYHVDSPYWGEPPVRFQKICPCGKNYECPICGYGTASTPHECRLIKIYPEDK